MGVKSFGYTSVDDNKLGFIGKVKGRRRKNNPFNTRIRLKYTPFWPFFKKYFENFFGEFRVMFPL